MPQRIRHVDESEEVPTLTRAMAHHVGGVRCVLCPDSELARYELVYVPTADGGKVYCAEHFEEGLEPDLTVPRMRLSALAA